MAFTLTDDAFELFEHYPICAICCSMGSGGCAPMDVEGEAR